MWKRILRYVFYLSVSLYCMGVLLMVASEVSPDFIVLIGTAFVSLYFLFLFVHEKENSTDGNNSYSYLLAVSLIALTAFGIKIYGF